MFFYFLYIYFETLLACAGRKESSGELFVVFCLFFLSRFKSNGSSCGHTHTRTRTHARTHTHTHTILHVFLVVFFVAIQSQRNS